MRRRARMAHSSVPCRHSVSGCRGKDSMDGEDGEGEGKNTVAKAQILLVHWLPAMY